MNPYVFVVGCPRSGTTLLQRMLDAHPLLAVIDETRWIDLWYARPATTADRTVTRDLVTRLLEFPRFAQLGLGREPVEALLDGGPVTYATFVSRLFDLHGTSQGKALVGDKTPRYVRSIPLLHELFPAARFIHLIRDGRATSLSVVNWRKAAKLAETFSTWKAHPLATAALWWEWQVRLGREAAGLLGPASYREVRYEMLVDDPAGELDGLCEFLSIPYDDKMLRFHEGRQRSPIGISAKSAWLPPTRGLRDWRTQMTAADVEVFEAIAGALLEELDHPRAVSEPSREARSVAVEVRAAFTADLQMLGRRIPMTWGSSTPAPL